MSTHINQYETLVEAMNDLAKRGYDKQLDITEEGIVNNETQKVHDPEDFTVEEYHRFEGDSDPDDMSVVYAVKGPKSLKGLIVDAYGTYSDDSVNDIIKRMKMKKGIS